jgi:hypothetical protein
MASKEQKRGNREIKKPKKKRLVEPKTPTKPGTTPIQIPNKN